MVIECQPGEVAIKKNEDGPAGPETEGEGESTNGSSAQTEYTGR